MTAKRLAAETSPYLLQHAENPVDWYPWGEEAFAAARAEDKPVLLSVGYSACHWCHVMAHESFEDEATAAFMNEHFINVKVDREERPDVDAVYMAAVQAMTGQGGWPMTVVMTPSGAPFFGGTYFPKDDRYAQPSFMRVLRSLSGAWVERREEVLESAQSAAQYLKRLSRLGEGGDLSEAVLEAALKVLVAEFDSQHGGFGGAPKFPPHGVLRFLLQRYRQRSSSPALIVETTLTQMARGGLYDQLAGGFARYSVDAQWRVPHFEKMLYDNAQLAQLYVEAFQLSSKPLYKRVAEETLDWLLLEMCSAEGGFYSALDADSDGVEGKFYVWNAEDFDLLLGEDAALAKAYFGVTAVGNFEGHNVLTSADPFGLAARFGLDIEAFERKLARVKKTLLEARQTRVRPGLDDKILTSWNGLALRALAVAGRVLNRTDYTEAARRNARFLRDKLLVGGRLMHTYKDAHAKVAGLLEDYAYLGLGLLELYRTTFDPEWFLLAERLAETVLAHFHDRDEGGFFGTADDAEALIIRPKSYFDAPNPSDNAAAAELLLTLARYTGRQRWEDLAVQTLTPLTNAVAQQPSGFGSALAVIDKVLSPLSEVALTGPLDSENTRSLIAELHRQFLPNTVFAHAATDQALLRERIPWLGARGLVSGQPGAYVCEGGACRLPVTTASALKDELEGLR